MKIKINMNLELTQSFDEVDLKRMKEITQAKTEEELLNYIKNKLESKECAETMAEYLSSESSVISNVRVEPVLEGQKLLKAYIDDLIKE